ncbi:MAG: hypothetical protein U1F87_13935 [Kiritimatiellia bacterium]
MIQQSVIAFFTLIPLNADHYRDALRLTVNQNLASGAVYDALHLIGARSARCDNLFTLNLRHFRSLAPGDSTIISP